MHLRSCILTPPLSALRHSSKAVAWLEAYCLKFEENALEPGNETEPDPNCVLECVDERESVTSSPEQVSNRYRIILMKP